MKFLALAVKKVVKSERVEIQGTEIRVNANKQQGIYLEMMEAAKSQLDAMLTHHSRVLVLRVDIRQQEYTGDNKPMSDFMRKLVKRLKRRYNLKRVGFIWAREIEKAKHQHYHLVIMLDGRAVQYPSAAIKLIESIAEGWNWPKPYTPRNCYYMVNRKAPEPYIECLYRISYLAKERGKGYKNSTANNYGRSNIKYSQ